MSGTAATPALSEAGYQRLHLSPAHYFDGDIFDRERDRIFFREWCFAGHISELAEPGDFIVCDLLDQSVVLTRGRDGRLRGFHNVCQHRGNRLVAERSGRGKRSFTCGYHCWSYDEAGRLRHAPRQEQVGAFDRSRYDIPPVQVEEVGGFVFFNLDPEASPLAKRMDGFEAELRRLLPDVDRLQPTHACETTIAANWKIVMDNNIEAYHLQFSGPEHRALANAIELDAFEFTPMGSWWRYTAPAAQTAQSAYGAPVSEAARERYPTFVNLTAWPFTTFFRLPFSAYVGAFVILPLGPEESLLRVAFYRDDGEDTALDQASVVWIADQLGPEDVGLNVSTQQGLRSHGFRGGRYMIDPATGPLSEHLVQAFHANVLAALNEGD
ncbi:MAG: aromatic ring-hydroxylating dioxygenase subunit alpha [Marivibrio sp.]|uniref:aromatic ring-hydroxylating oxygenase subunit alpha n=1 Tax=Marivibrio sp. TaxID=2039719 RepID=UPI0032EC30F2